MRLLGLLLGFSCLALMACGGPRTGDTPAAIFTQPPPAASSSPSLPSLTPDSPGKTATPTRGQTATGQEPASPSQQPAGGDQPPTAAPALTPTPSPALAPLTPIGIVLENANLRAGPGTGFEIIGDIAAGQEVKVSGQTAAGEWLRLDMDTDEVIWIASFLVDLPAGLELPILAALPAPSPTPVAGDVVTISDAAVTLPTYPWQQFTSPAYDEAAGWEYLQFDRAAYEASSPQPSPRSYRLVGLENRWLRLTLMPDLGGRIYQMVFKPTGNNELYQNPVIKPSPWGPGPNGNGWLAAGGIEWGLPVVEHGYAWADVWGYITEPVPPAGAVTVFTQDQDRLQLNVRVGLTPDSAAFSLDFDLENRAQKPVVFSYWTNAMLAPGAANQAGPDLRFLFPGSQIAIHSAGDEDLPQAGSVVSWPEYNGRDLSRLGTWNRWLGFFAHPNAQSGWSAVYDAGADEGVVRIFPSRQAPGLKGFGFGWADPIPPANYTDDGSSYVEMHGGLTPTFDQSLTFQPDQMQSWREVWYPAAGIGGVTAADANGAVNLTSTNDGLRLRLFSVSSRTGEMVVNDSRGALLRTALTLDPAHPADLALPGAQGPISFQFRAATGTDWQMAGLVPDRANVVASLILPQLQHIGAPGRYALYLPMTSVVGA